MISRTGLDLLTNRRHFLSRSAGGLGGMALASLLAEEDPYRARPSHQAAKAKNVIVVFCSGALSHVDTFDYKPALIRHHGQPLPGQENLVSFQGPNGNLVQSLWKFRPRGQSGKMVSDLVPRIGDMADDLCFLHAAQ